MHSPSSRCSLLVALLCFCLVPSTRSRHIHHRRLHKHHNFLHRAETQSPPPTTFVTFTAPSPTPFEDIPIAQDTIQIDRDLEALANDASRAYLDFNQRISRIRTLVNDILLRVSGSSKQVESIMGTSSSSLGVPIPSALPTPSNAGPVGNYSAPTRTIVPTITDSADQIIPGKTYTASYTALISTTISDHGSASVATSAVPTFSLQA